MATKVDKKNAIRQGITEAEIVYFQNLAGKTFLYVCGDEYFEASFPIRSLSTFNRSGDKTFGQGFLLRMQKNLFLQIISSILTQDMYMQMPKGNFRV